MESKKWIAVLIVTLILGAGVNLWAAERDFPKKPIQFIVPYAAGGGQDMLARGIAPYLEKHLGVSVQIENVPGAGGKIGFTKVWKASPDGYTITTYVLPVPIILEKLSKVEYKTNEFTPIFAWSESNQVWVVHSEVYKTLEDFLNVAKTKTLSSGLPGRGTSAHLAGLLAVDGFGIKVNWVPFSGGAEALTALAGKHIDCAIVQAPTALSLVRSGKLRPLMVFANEKDPVYPEAPIPKEKGYKISAASSLRGVVASPGLPAAIATSLEKAFEKAIQEPGYKEWGERTKTDIVPVSSKEYQKIIEEQYKLVEKYIHLLN
jgi:tripartite-type tricarboxylate transporter receptor subunit TctC